MGALRSELSGDALSPLHLKKKMRKSAAAPSFAKTVLVVDTDAGFAETRQFLGGLGFDVLPYQGHVSPEVCTIALINPEVDPDLKICKLLSEQCKVLLTTNKRDFQFKIEAVRMGAKGLLSYPLDAVEVFSSLEDTRKTDLADARVLLIDDDELTASVYAMALEECGLRVAVLVNPLHAEAAIREFRPDLMIMDIDMPQASGLDVARAIRLDPANISLPILFLSAINKKDLQQQAREIGGDDFIKKPVDIGYLVKMVRMRASRAVELRQIMDRDGLTGLINHVSFKERLAAELNRSNRTNADFTVALLDLDHFKAINDTYGHQTGDQVIQTFATQLKSSLRNVDIIGRYGGEEFAIILLDALPEQAEKTINRIRREFERVEFSHKNTAFNVTFSCGLSGRQDAGSCEELLALADAALYDAKRAGRNCVVRHEAEGRENRDPVSLKR